MEPALNTAFFDLPDSLDAKRSGALIATDVQNFEAIAANLERSVAEITARLDSQRLVRGESSGEVVERDAEIRRLSARLRTLQRYSVDSCLGRVVETDATDPLYIGRFGLTDASGRRLLIDWRSPAAEPFFGATHAHPLGLESRRRYRWTRGRVTDYWDEVFTAEGLESAAALDDQSAFIASLGASRSPRMRDVLGTIQADQDAIIRAGSRGALVVDGGPGTGKTVVALHRTAYLLYSDARLGHGVGSGSGGVLFVGPSPAYLAYVEDVLPSLGEEGVQACTLRDLVPEGAQARDETPEVAALKSSARLLGAVEAAVRSRELPPKSGVLVETPWDDIWFSPDDWEEAFDAADSDLAHNEARDSVWDRIVEIIADRVDWTSRRYLGRVLRDTDLAIAFERAWPLLDPVALVAELWSDAAFLKQCAPWLATADLELLKRTDARVWSTADLPYLDAARRRVGDPDSHRHRRERRAALAAQRETMDRVVDDLVAADDDGVGLVTMLRVEDAQHSLIDEAALPTALPDELAGPYGHIVVDEAQELTDAEWQILLARCPSRSFTIVGDRAQARRGFSESWPERLERVGFGAVSVASLTINYRTPEEVMHVAAPEILAALPDANVPESVRSSGVPVRHGDASELQSIVDDWLAGHPEGIACVIGAGGFESGARVRALRPERAKGLEFDLVVVVDPERWGHGITGAVDRYVAMTRATQELVILRSSSGNADSVGSPS